MFIPAVFWESDEDEKPQDALVTVQDALVVHITRADGLEVRLLLHEFVALAEFVANEAERQDNENGAQGESEALEADELPF